jgi:hypothetical protein
LQYRLHQKFGWFTRQRRTCERPAQPAFERHAVTSTAIVAQQVRDLLLPRGRRRRHGFRSRLSMDTYGQQGQPNQRQPEK